MRVDYYPESEQFWLAIIEDQQQIGGGFRGQPYQRGLGLGSFFSSLFRSFLPMGKAAAKAIGRQALSTGAAIAGDVLAGKAFKDSAEVHGKEAASNLLEKAANKLKEQTGSGLGCRPSSRKTVKRRQTASRTTAKNSKRKKPDTFDQ